MTPSTWIERHRRSILALFVLAAIAGLGMSVRLPVGLFPRTTFPRVVVSVDAGDRPADRMALEVTRPLEETVRGIPGLRSIRSTTSRGSSEISINFDWGIDMIAATLEVHAAISQILKVLPPETSFEVRRMDPTIFPIIGLSLTSHTETVVSLRNSALLDIVPLLSSVPGVARVGVQGGETREIQVRVDPARLEASGISLDELTHAVAAANVVRAIGRLEENEKLYLLLADTQISSLDELRSVIVRRSDEGVVLLGDVANVEQATEPQWTRVTADGRDAVLVSVYQQPEGNALEIEQGVRARLGAYLAAGHPDVAVHWWYDQTKILAASLSSLRESILIGVLLAAFVLWVFLRDLRATTIAVSCVPLALGGTLLAMAGLGDSLNIMTLGGMAAAVGLVIDDAIVIIEHIERRRVESAGAVHAIAAAAELRTPLVASSAATIGILLPLAYLTGVTGVFFRALSTTMAIALILSLGIAALVIPALATDRHPGSAAHPVPSPRHGSRWEKYHRTLRWYFSHRPLGGTVIALLLLAGVAATRFVAAGFLPAMDEGGFVLDYRTPPGTSLAETDRRLRAVEQVLVVIPEIDTYSRRTGLALGGGLTEANEGDFFVRLKDPPRRPIEDVMDEVRTRVEHEVPGIDIELAQLLEDVIGDLTAVPQPIEVKLLGQDPTRLQAEASRVADAVSRVPGVVDVRDGVVLAGDGIDIRVDRTKAELLGVDPESVTRAARTLLAGDVVTTVQRGQQMVGIRLWSDQHVRARLDQILSLRLPGAQGPVRLGRVATPEFHPGQAQVTRENMQPMVAVTGRISGRDLGSVMKEVRAAVAGTALPAGIQVAYGGLYDQQQQSFRGLVMVLAAATLLVFLILLYLYESWRAPLAILGVAALAGCGTMLGLLATRTELDVSSMMGLTMIVGIAAEASIFYVSEWQLLCHEMDDDEALVNATLNRTRPVLMTSLAAILALLPLAVGLGGASLLRPLAIAIELGLLATIPSVLLALPIFLGGASGNRASP
ncbi:efflux RND transporter permease subunit [Candidatus Binatia bacterium]|nr:efflux RND transporter permease subunit [Candidatus Binatia bacterium]